MGRRSRARKRRGNPRRFAPGCEQVSALGVRIARRTRQAARGLARLPPDGPVTAHSPVKPGPSIRRGRSDRGSSPCPTPPRSHARTSPSSRHMRRPPRALGAGSARRRRGRRRWPVHLTSPVARSRPSYTFSAEADAFHSVPMSSRFTKKSLVNVSGRSVKTPCWDCPKLAFRAPHAADENRHLGSGQRQQVGPVQQQGLRRQLLSGSEVVAEPVGGRFEHGERLHVGLLLRGVRAPRRERDRDVVPGVLRRLLDGRASAQDDQVGERDLLSAGL